MMTREVVEVSCAEGIGPHHPLKLKNENRSYKKRPYAAGKTSLDLRILYQILKPAIMSTAMG